MTRSSVDVQQIAEAALAAARNAAEYLRAAFGRPQAIAARKQHTDFATTADLEAERIICETLRLRAPQWPILSEEHGDESAARSHTGGGWIVDPLCGTLNFYHGIPIFCVNIAFVQHSQPLVAVVADVIQGELLLAIQGQGATIIDGAGSHTLARAQDHSSLVGIDLGERMADGAALLQGMPAENSAFDLRVFGSSIIYAYLAQGRICGLIHDLSAPWDYAAGCLVCAESGAIVTDALGQPWKLDSRTVIAAATAEIHAQLLSMYRHAAIFRPEQP